MKKALLITGVLLSSLCFSQHYIQGSIQQGAAANSANIAFLPNYNSGPAEYISYLSISIAIPTASATGVTPTITGGGNLNGLVFVQATPFSYTSGTEKIFSWICNNLTVTSMSWSNGVSFTGATITFAGGSGTSKVRLVDFTNAGGGSNGNTLFSVVTNVPPFDVTNFSDFFFTIADPNGSTEGTYPNGDSWVETNSLINMSAVCPAPSSPTVTNITTTTADISWSPVSGVTGYEYAVTTSSTPPASGTPTTSTSYNATGLSIGTQYYAHVRSNCGGGNFSSWATTPFSTLCPNPSAPTVINITATTADISWNPVSGVSGYEYAVTISSTPPASGTATAGTSYNATGLITGTQYYAHVRSSCSPGIFSAWATTPFITLCASPTAPVVSSITDNSADISWNPVSGVSGYEYAVTTSSTPPASGTTTTGTSYNATGLTTGTQYYAHVRSSCSAGNFSGWVTTPFITLCGSPSAPVVTNITTTTADINWGAVSGVIGYEYAVTTSSTPPASGTATTGTSYNATGLTPASQYYAHVRSSCSAGNFSGWVTTGFITQTPSCSSPTALVINNITTTTVDINWNSGAGAVGSEYAVTTSLTPPSSGTPTTGTSYNATGLTPGTAYYAHVRSDCGFGFFSSWVTTAFTTLCPAPTAPVVSNITNTTADISWNPVSGATGYQYAVTTSSTPPASGTATTGTSYNATGLTTGTQYYAHVRSSCSAGNFSGWVTTTFVTLCGAPTAPVVSNISTTTADISWGTVSGVIGYEYAVTSSSTPPASGTATTGTTYNATGLTTGTQYYAHVRSSCSAGNFSGWVTTGFVTLCGAPTAPVVNNITTTTADINWTAVSGVAGYQYAITTSSTPPASGTATTGTSYNATGLTTGTQYYAHVRSSCSAGNFSAWVTTPFITVCASPAIPTVSNITATTADINWSAVSGVTGYQYAVTTSSTPPASGTATTGTSYSASGLTPGTQYYIHLRSSCSAGNFSVWMSTPFTTVCPATTTPTVTGITATTATINWTAVSGATLYQFAVTTSATAPASGTATVFTTAPVTGLTTGTLYYVYVRSVCSPGIFSAWASTTFTTLCPPPLSITIANISSSADISWIAPGSGTAGYQYAVTTDSVPPVSGTFTSGTSYQATNLNSFTTYYVHVRSQCSPGIYSSWIRRSFVTTCFKPIPFVISNGISTGTADLGWNAVHGAVNYEYSILTSAASPGGSLLFTTDTVLHINGLRGGGQFYLHVRTHCGPTDISEWSVLEFHTSGIEVYPNPVTDIATIKVFGQGNAIKAISIYDANGRLMKRVQLIGNTLAVDMHGWAAGLYFIRYGSENGYVTKMLKQ